jgi:uncharacterized phiE125 gp8 family phage protein
MWTTSVITAATAEPLDLTTEVIPFLRLGGDEASAQATILAGMVSGARQACENFTGRKLITQTLELWAEHWYEEGLSRCGRLRLPWAPVSSITSVTYLDTNGAAQTWSSVTGWEAVLPAGDFAPRAELYPRYGTVLPSIRCRPDSIKVRYVAGYGATFATVPARLRQGMLLLIGEAYKNREVSGEGIVGDTPISAERAWWPFRSW